MNEGLGLPKEKAFQTFVNNLMFYYTNKKYNMKSRSRNGKLYDLGFDPRQVNKKDKREIINPEESDADCEDLLYVVSLAIYTELI